MVEHSAYIRETTVRFRNGVPNAKNMTISECAKTVPVGKAIHCIRCTKANETDEPSGVLQWDSSKTDADWKEHLDLLGWKFHSFHFVDK